MSVDVPYPPPGTNVTDFQPGTGCNTFTDLRARSRWLAEHATNIHSQTGEDGIIAHIFEVIGAGDRTSVDIGAWDGLHGSNTRALLARGWRGVQVECEPAKHARLAQLYHDRPDVHCLRRFVRSSGPDNLDAILDECGVSPVFDLLSIDVDGNDYHLWASLHRHRPRVVVIEYNFSIPDEIVFIQPDDARVGQGASLRALVELGKAKGYELVLPTGLNAIFVDASFYPTFAIPDNSLEVMHVPAFCGRTHVFFGYDGTVFVRGAARLPWHDVPFPEGRVQMLPKGLRSHHVYRGWRLLWFLIVRARLRGHLWRPAKWRTALRFLCGLGGAKR